MEEELSGLMREYCLINDLELEGLYIENDPQEDNELCKLIWYAIKDDNCYNNTLPNSNGFHFIAIEPVHMEYNLKDDTLYGLFEVPSTGSCDFFKPREFERFCAKKTRPNSRMAKWLEAGLGEESEEDIPEVLKRLSAGKI